MVKVLLHIAIAVALTSGSGLPALASFESSAPWERGCDALLWAQRVRADVYAVAGGKMRLGSHCDRYAFIEMQHLKDAATKELRSCSGSESKYARFLRLIIDNIERIEIAGTDRSSRKRDDLCTSMTGHDLPRGFAGGLPAKRSGMIRTASVPAPPPGGGHHPRTAAAHWDRRLEERRVFNPGKYSFNTARVDYYRLFLYLWEDTPRGTSAERSSLPRPVSLPPLPSRIPRKNRPGVNSGASAGLPHTATQGVCS